MQFTHLIGRKHDLKQLIAFCDVRISIWKRANMKEFVKIYTDMRKQFAQQLLEVELLLSEGASEGGDKDGK